MSIFSDVINSAKDLVGQGMDYLKTEFDKGWKEYKSFTGHVNDFMTGSDDAFRALQEKYKNPFEQQQHDLVVAMNHNQVSESDAEKQYKELQEKAKEWIAQKATDNPQEYNEFVKRQQEIQFNTAMNMIPMGGMEEALSGGAKRVIAKIAKSESAEEIAKLLGKFKVSDDIAKELSEKLVGVKDIPTAFRMSKAGQVISGIEKELGEKVVPELRQKLAEGVNTIMKGSFEKNTQEMALKKLSEDFMSAFKEDAIKKAEETLTKLPDTLHPTLEAAKEFDNFGAFKKSLSGDTVKELNKSGVTVEDVFKAAKTELPKTNEKAGDVIKPVVKKETVKEVVKSQDEEIRKGLLDYSKTLDEKVRNAANPDEMAKIESTRTQVDDLVKKIDENKISPEERLNAREMLKLNEAKITSTLESKDAQIAQKELERTQRLEAQAAKEAQKKENVKSIKESLKIANKATGEMKTSDVKRIVRSNTGQIKDNNIVISERKLLTEKFKTMRKAAAEGKRSALSNARKLRDEVRKHASDLPKSIQRKILSQTKFHNIKSEQQLKEVLDNVDLWRGKVAKEMDRREILREVLPLLKTIREKGKLGMIKGDVRSLGMVNKDGMPLKNMREGIKRLSKEKLEQLKTGIMDALDTSPKPIDHAAIDYKKMEMAGTSQTRWQGIKKQLGQGIERGLGVASTNIKKYGGEELMYAIRRRRYEINRLGKEAEGNMRQFMEGMAKMKGKYFGRGKEDYNKITNSLFNQDFNTAKEVAKKNGFSEGLNKIIGVLDDIHKRANEVGLKVGKLENYFPRIVKDYDGLFAAYNKKFGNEGRSYLDRVLTETANAKFKKVSELTLDERAEALTNTLRGYGAGKINVGNVMRSRKFNTLPPEFAKFYHSPEESLVMYVSKMNERIQLKKLFGLDGNEQDSIGGMVDGLNISPNDAYRLKEALGAVLSPQGKENWALNKMRKGATLTLLAHVQSALTQIGDIGLNIYEHGLGRSLASWFRSKPFKRDELFTEIAHEFADSNVIKRSLKVVGFDRLDRLNNEAYMANSFRKAVSATRKGSGRVYKDLVDYATPMLRNDSEKLAQFMDDLKNKRITDDVKFYVFNKALDINPRAIEEMPEAYLKNPNARVLYSMKSYGIKVLDVYRNDVMRKWGGNKKKAAKNFILLTGALTASGASVDQIRDWYNGKQTNFSGKVFDNLAKLALLSTWDVSSIKRDGLGRTLMAKTLPPTRLIDDLSRDLLNAGDGKGLYSTRNIPVIGGEIYNRLGRGKDQIDKQNEQNGKMKKLQTLKKMKKLKTLKKF